MKTVISVKIDKQVKESAQEVANSAGLTLSALVNSYLRQISATRRIEIYAPEKATPKLEKLIEEVEKEINRGETAGPFNNAEDLLKELHKKPR